MREEEVGMYGKSLLLLVSESQPRHEERKEG